MATDSHQSIEGGTDEFFPSFARIWACATLVHQLAFTFWAESWQGWVLVIAATAVIFQPSCLHRFIWLVGASVLNLFNKLPFVPNHILFEGMLHVIMILALIEFFTRSEGKAFLKNVITRDWKTWFLVTVIGIKIIYHLTLGAEKNYIFGSITTALLLLAIGLFLFGREPVRSGEWFFSRIAPVIRFAVVIMYFWAAIQKMNFDYLNPEVSCASKLHLEIAKYFGELVPTKTWALHGAIWGSLLFEIAIPILLLIPKTRVVGVISAVWFHLWLSIHPAAGIFSFTSLILAILYLFLPVGIWRQLMKIYHAQLTKIGGGSRDKGSRIAAVFVITFFLVILFTQVYLYLSRSRSYDTFSIANRVGFIAFAAWALWMGTCYVIAAIKAGTRRENIFPNQPVKTLAWLGLILVVMNGASPWIGGKTQTAFSMYSNLRSEGEGNHTFLKRIDILPFQKNMVRVVRTEPNILDPSTRPKGIANFANEGHKILPYFELRRLLSTTAGNVTVTYEQAGEIKTVSRIEGVVSGDEKLLQPIPLLARKFFWFRRLNSLVEPMTCTH